MLINYTNIKNTLFYLRTFGFRATVRKVIDSISFRNEYAKWYEAHAISSEILDAQKTQEFGYRPRISIIVPVYRTPDRFLRDMINSVISQTYSEWELCIADGSTDFAFAYIKDIVQKYQQKHPGIRYLQLSENLGISGNTNAALSLASGDYIALLDHDDMLAPNALYEIAALLNQHPETDVIYTDEDKMNSQDLSHYDPYFKPDFNLDLLRSCNYITHFYVVRKRLADQVGGFSSECDGSQDYDFILKTCDLAEHIRHIPLVLYHWRTHPASVAGDPESKSYAYDSAVRALQHHMARCGERATVSRATHFGYYHTVYQITGTPLVSIVTIGCKEPLIEQIRKITTYSNYEFAQSFEKANGLYFIILSQIRAILTPDWIEQMLGNCQRSSVGIVSPRIYCGPRNILEAGLIYTPDGKVHSPFFTYLSEDPGYCFHLVTQRNCSLVGPHCVMISKALFNSYYPLCKKSSFERNIYELCLLIREEHKSIVFLPTVNVISLRKRSHLPQLDETGSFDPFYNPNFSQSKMYQLPK